MRGIYTSKKTKFVILIAIFWLSFTGWAQDNGSISPQEKTIFLQEKASIAFTVETPEGPETVTVESDQLARGSYELKKQGIIIIATDAIDKVSFPGLKKEQFKPIVHNGNLVGYWAWAKDIKRAEFKEKVKMALVGASATGLSVAIGQVLAHTDSSLQALIGIPFVMGFSLLYRFYYQNILDVFNYSSLTPKQMSQVIALGNEYRRTNIRPAGLRDASRIEKLGKMFVVTLVFMGLADIGSVTSIGSATFDSVMAFLRSSVWYTLMATYDLILGEKRDLLIQKFPNKKLTIERGANLLSMAIAFGENILAMLAMNGVKPAEWGLLGSAAAVNTYFFGRNFFDSLKKFLTPVAPANRCVSLFSVQ